jgi:hypothetical protein
MSLLLTIGGWLFRAVGFVYGLFSNRQPPQVQEGQSLGAASQALQTETQANDQVAQARAASDAVDAAVVRDPSSLRAADPDSRD